MRKSDLLYERSKEYRDLLDKISDSIREEDHYGNENNFIAAADAGLRTWDSLKNLMMLSNVKNICDLDYHSGYDLLYWASSLSNNLHNAAIKDISFLEKKHAFCKEYIEMHKDYLSKGMRNLGNIRRAFAECYIDSGDFEMFDGLYTKWLQKEPDWGWGWIGWSDSYWLFTRKNKKNLEKALSILEQGLAVKGVDDKNHMIDRLNQLKSEMLNQPSLSVREELDEIN
jgi:hypothetical protein